MTDMRSPERNENHTPAEDPQIDVKPSLLARIAGSAVQKTSNATADVLGYTLGVANAGALGAARTASGAWSLFMIPLKHATALGYTGFSAFVVGTGFALKTIGKGIGFAAGTTWGGAKWAYRPFAPAVNKAANTVLPPIGRGLKTGGQAMLTGLNAISPIVTVPAGAIKKGLQATGRSINVAITPLYNFGKRHFPKTTEKAENLVKLIGEHRPVDALAYPLAGLYMAVRGLYKAVYGILDVSARFIGRRLYNNFPKTSQNFLDGYDIARNTVRDTIQSLPPEKAFGLVAVMSALAYAVSPVVGGYYTLYATNEAIRSSAIIIPKILKITAGTTTYLCWDQAKQSKGFEKVKKIYDPFSDAVGWIRNKVDDIDDFFEKHVTIYSAAKNAVKGNKMPQAEPKKYKGKLAKLGSKIIPGYRRADEHQERMTNYIVSTRVYKLGEQGVNASVHGLKKSWDAVAPYHNKLLDTGARATAKLPAVKLDFNSASGFKERILQRRREVVDAADNATSSLGRAFGLSKTEMVESTEDKAAPMHPDQADAKQMNDHTPR